MATTAAPSAESAPDASLDLDAIENKAEAILDHIIRIKGGSRRDGQVRMARLVARNLATGNPTLLQGGTGIGKALDVDTPIPTPRGFVRMGDLKVGDEVFDERGNICRVTHAFDVRYGRPCSELAFSDGSALIADDEHQWDTITRTARRTFTGEDPWAAASTTTTAQIRETLLASGKQRSNHSIPLAGPIQTKPGDLPLAPYALGIWLGGTRPNGQVAYIKHPNGPADLDGFIAEADTKQTVFTPTEDTLLALKDLLGEELSKTIPEKYLFAAEDQRRALLAGLLDASGFVVGGQRHVGGQVQFTEVYEPLARATHALACSLGFRATINPRNRPDGTPMTWVVAFSPNRPVFQHAQAKNARLGEPEGSRRTTARTITAVTKVPSRPVRCISVDSPRHLYLAGTSFIPTHNSIGYLAGALATGKQVVVAPHTKALQDQLRADLDLIASAFNGQADAPLDHTPTYSVIKGRGSYLCLDKVRGPEDSEQATLSEAGDSDGPTSDLGREVKALAEWADTTEVGDRSEVPFPVSYKAWGMVSVTPDDCKTKGCAFYRDEDDLCFAERARMAAKEADIIVVNQAYLAMSMKYPALLPETVAAVVVDEAHEFPSVVSNTFGAQVNARRLKNVLDKTTVLEQVTDKAEKQREDAADAIEEFEGLPVPRTADRDLPAKPQVTRVLEKCSRAFEQLAQTATGMPQTDEEETARRELMLRMLGNVVFDLKLLLMGTTDKQVAWAEPDYGRIQLRSAQFDVAETIFEKLLKPFRSVAFTSATLTVAGRFDQPAKDYGFTLAPWRGEVVESPFDYTRQGMVWTPAGMPFPGKKPEDQEEYTDAVADVVEKVARAAGGRTLVLCTSRASVTNISDILRDRLGDEYPILVQEPGEPTKPLAQKFSQDPRAILIGTRSFWTGVSLEGDTCSAVILDKLPFPSPGEPIIAAKGEKADRQGGSGFREVYLSEACLTVVQGAGRLIRTVHDRGVVVLCDPRVHDRSEHRKMYGRDVMRSLPPFPVTTDEEQVMNFLREIDRTADDSHNTVVIEEEAV